MLDCNSLSLGQVTLCFTSSHECLKKSTTLFIFALLVAQAPGLEPRLTVLFIIIVCFVNLKTYPTMNIEFDFPPMPDRFDNGFVCGVCGSYVKRYTRKFNSNMAIAMIALLTFFFFEFNYAFKRFY